MVEYTGKYEVSKSGPVVWLVYAVRVGGEWERVATHSSKRAAMDDKREREQLAAAKKQERAAEAKLAAKVPQ